MNKTVSKGDRVPLVALKTLKPRVQSTGVLEFAGEPGSRKEARAKPAERSGAEAPTGSRRLLFWNAKREQNS